MELSNLLTAIGIVFPIDSSDHFVRVKECGRKQVGSEAATRKRMAAHFHFVFFFKKIVLFCLLSTFFLLFCFFNSFFHQKRG